MSTHPQDLKTRAAVDPEAFMGGVALFDEMLEQLRPIAEQARTNETNFWISADAREGKPLVLHALPALCRLQGQPEAAIAGFAAALGDYLGTWMAGMGFGEGAAYRRMEFDSVWIDDSEPEPEPSNVVPLLRRAGAAA